MRFRERLKLTKKTDAFLAMGFANRTKVSKYARPMGTRAPSQGGQRRAGFRRVLFELKMENTEKSLVTRGFLRYTESRPQERSR